MAILGSGLYNVVIAVAVFNIPKFARPVRGNTLETKNSVFVQAARNIDVYKRQFQIRPELVKRYVELEYEIMAKELAGLDGFCGWQIWVSETNPGRVTSLYFWKDHALSLIHI